LGLLDAKSKERLQQIVGAENFYDSQESWLVYSYDATPHAKKGFTYIRGV
jgi:hypothetical protein